MDALAQGDLAARERVRMQRWRDLQAVLVLVAVATAVFWWVPGAPL